MPSVPTQDDPRQLDNAAERVAAWILTSVLETDTARGESEGDRESNPNDWPSWTDNRFIGLTD